MLIWLRRGLLASITTTAACFSEDGGGSGADTHAADSSASGPGTSGSNTTAVDTGTSSDAGSSSSSTGGEACPEGTVYAPAVPQGWTAFDVITAVAAGDDPPACPLQLQTQPELLGALQEPGTAACKCVCPTAASTICAITVQTTEQCTNIGNDTPEPLGDDCLENTLPAVSLHADPQAIVPMPQPRGEGMLLFRCAAPDTSACVPRPPESYGPCIHHDGELACPESYPVAFPVWATQCDACSMPDTAAYCAGLHVSWFYSGDCSGVDDGYALPNDNCAMAADRHSLRASPEPLSCPDTTATTTAATVCCVAQ
ncbi:MAG: hypothetical protein K1X88_30690 [Nannocystaceae bacterium]|nr:hypothetical protein [Nannocystaceae bacterium]